MKKPLNTRFKSPIMPIICKCKKPKLKNNFGRSCAICGRTVLPYEIGVK